MKTGFHLVAVTVAIAGLLAVAPAAFADDLPPADPAPEPAPFEPAIVPPIYSPPVELPPSTIPQGTFDPPVSYPVPTSEPIPYGTLPDGSPVYQAPPPAGWVPGNAMPPIPDDINQFVMSHPSSTGWMFITMPDGRIVVSAGGETGGTWIPLDELTAAAQQTASTAQGPELFEEIAAQLKLAAKGKISAKSASNVP